MRTSLLYILLFCSFFSKAQQPICTGIKFLVNTNYLNTVFKYSDNELYFQGRFSDTLILNDTAIYTNKQNNYFVLNLDDSSKTKNIQVFTFSGVDNNIVTQPFKNKKSHLIITSVKDSAFLNNTWYYSKGIWDGLLMSYTHTGSLEWVKQIGDEDSDGFGSMGVDKQDNIWCGLAVGRNINKLPNLYPITYNNILDRTSLTANTPFGQDYLMKLNSKGEVLKYKAVVASSMQLNEANIYISKGFGISGFTMDGIKVKSNTTGFTDGASGMFRLDTNFVAKNGFSISPMNQNTSGTGGGVGFSNRIFDGDALGNSYFAGTYDQCGVNVSSPTTTDAIINPTKAFINNDIIIVKYNALGKFVYAKSAGNVNAFDYVNSILPDDKGNLYVCGGYSEKIKFGNDSLTCTNSNMFIAKLDAVGNTLWLKQCQGNSGAANNMVILNDSTIAVLCYLVQGSNFDGFVANKNGYYMVYFKEFNWPAGSTNYPMPLLNTYPNPANDILTIEGQVSDLSLFDILGNKQTITFKNFTNKTEINTSSLNNGLYFITVKKEHQFFKNKIYIQH